LKASPARINEQDFTEVPERHRRLLADLVGGSGEQIVLGNSTSYGLRLIVIPAMWILTVERDYPATVLPCKRLEGREVRVGSLNPGSAGLGAAQVREKTRPAVDRRLGPRYPLRADLPDFIGALIEDRSWSQRRLLTTSPSYCGRPSSPNLQSIDAPDHAPEEEADVADHQIESAFTEVERNYLQGQRVGRLVTLSRDGSPQARPVGFTVREEFIEIGGLDLAATQKFRNIARDPRVSFLVDDLASVDPWHVRGVEIRGEAQALPAHDGTDAAMRVFPARILRWGLTHSSIEARTVSSATQ
jgi:pyridoxamine 5'-phosphate oxidase family protein